MRRLSGRGRKPTYISSKEPETCVRPITSRTWPSIPAKPSSRPARSPSSAPRRRWQGDRPSESTEETSVSAPLTPLGEGGCTGFGALRRAWTERSTVRIWSAGDHLSLRISRQIRPSLSRRKRAKMSRVHGYQARDVAGRRTDVGVARRGAKERMSGTQHKNVTGQTY